MTGGGGEALAQIRESDVGRAAAHQEARIWMPDGA